MSDVNRLPSDDDLVRLANGLLERLHVSGRIKHWTEINSNVFVTLLEGLWGEPLPDAIHHPRCKDDEIHNCQSVMNTLAMDLLNTSLSHISARDIVNKDKAAISNLLDVFAGLFEYMVDKISSDISREDESDVSDADPDLVTPEIIDSILKKELKRTHNSSVTSRSPMYNSLTSHSAESPYWKWSSPEYNHDEPSDIGKISEGYQRRITVSGVLPHYTSAYRDGNGPMSKTCNITDSMSSVNEVTGNTISHLATSIDQARRQIQYTGDSSTAESTLKSSYKTAPTSELTRDIANIKSSSGSRSTAATVTASLATTAATTSSASGIQPTLNHDGLGLSEKPQGQFDNLGIRQPKTMGDMTGSLHTTQQATAEQAVHHKHTHYLYHYVGKEDEKPSSLTPSTRRPDSHHLARSLPLSSSVSHTEGQRRTHSYENLQNLVRNTVEISRAAISSKPVGVESNTTSEKSLKKDTAVSCHREGKLGRSKKTASDKSANRLRQTNTVSPKQSARVTSPKKNVSFANDPTRSLPLNLETKQDVLSKPRYETSAVGATSRSVLAEQLAPEHEISDAPLLNSKPKTVREYLLKYYGHDRVRSYSDGDANSDSEEGGYRSGSEASFKPSVYEKQLKEKAKKMVKFDDMLDSRAPGTFGNLRRKLQKEGEKNRLQTAYIDKMYEEDLNEHEDEVFERLKKAKKKAEQVEKQYKSVLKERSKKLLTTGKRKSLVSVRTRRSRSRSGVVHGRKRSLSCSPTVGRRNVAICENDLMPWLLEEFPYIHISPQTLHHMWNKSAHQIEQLSKVEQDVKRRKSKAQVQIEEAEMKQKILSEIMKKELKHKERLNEIKERRKQTQSVKAKIREHRLQSARCRKYYEEYHVRNRSRMLKKKSKEEMIFRRLFEDALSIQKERIRELRKYAREQRNEKARKQQDHLESLENYYKDQYNMLMETLAREREELDIREKAQTKVLNALKRELQKKMEKEIREFQEQLYRDEDEAYFRQIDADRIRHELNLARYQAKI